MCTMCTMCTCMYVHTYIYSEEQIYKETIIISLSVKEDFQVTFFLIKNVNV